MIKEYEREPDSLRLFLSSNCKDIWIYNKLNMLFVT